MLDDFARDRAVRVVVVSGAGDKAFVCGADVHQTGLYGTGPANDSLTVRLKNSAGTLLDSVSATTDGNGNLSLARTTFSNRTWFVELATARL